MAQGDNRQGRAKPHKNVTRTEGKPSREDTSGNKPTRDQSGGRSSRQAARYEDELENEEQRGNVDKDGTRVSDDDLDSENIPGRGKRRSNEDWEETERGSRGR